MKGDKYCVICGEWIGNYNTGETPDGIKSYYSIIRLKYCNQCRPMMINQQTKIRLHNLNQRKRQERKQERTRLELLEEENKLLRKYVSELRQQLERNGIYDLQR